jgi:DNA-binding transcriptional regulator YhcF (GntR family)
VSSDSPLASGTNGEAVPPYLRIAEELRNEIRDGTFGVGHQIPTQHALSQRFDVARATVQRALDELRREGYIDSQQGKGNYVLTVSAEEPEARSERREPGVAGAELADHIARAFQARHVTLDVVTFTTESFVSAVQPALQRIRKGELHPESIKVRVLLPSLEQPLVVPRRVDEPDDPRPLARLRELVRVHTGTLVSSMQSLADLELVPTISVEVRSVATTPLNKVYLLNGTEVLHGYYNVVERHVRDRGDEMQIYDFLGLKALLFHHSAVGEHPDPHDEAFVWQSQQWFEALWSTVARPMTLSE